MKSSQVDIAFARRHRPTVYWNHKCFIASQFKPSQKCKG